MMCLFWVLFHHQDFIGLTTKSHDSPTFSAHRNKIPWLVRPSELIPPQGAEGGLQYEILSQENQPIQGSSMAERTNRVPIPGHR